MNSIAAVHACAFTVLNLKKVIVVTSWRNYNCYNVMGISFNENQIDRAHGIGKPFLDKERKKKVRSIIVKFKSWKARAAFYKARPKNYVNGRKKPGLTSFSVSLDLTKRRYSLLAKAKSIIKDNPAVMFAFADINCSLALKLNDD